MLLSPFRNSRVLPFSDSAISEGSDHKKRKQQDVKAVCLGEAPDLQAILSGEIQTEPFDLTSFREFAKKNLFEEALDFLAEIPEFEFQCELENGKSRWNNASEYVVAITRLLDTYIKEGSDKQVNISATERKETEARAKAAIQKVNSLFDSSKDHAVDWDLEMAALPGDIFEVAKRQVYTMTKRDQYTRYVNHIVIQRRLVISTKEAMWWKNMDGLTLRAFFTFPSPVNTAESRIHNLTTCVLLIVANVLAYFCNFPWVFLMMLYGFVARSSCGPRLDPQAFLVLFVVRPIVTDYLGLLENDYKPGSPKRFAQMVGAFFSLILTILVAFQQWIPLWAVSSMFFVAAGFAGSVNWCVACEGFLWASRKGYLPESLCQECYIAYVQGDLTSVCTRSKKMKSPSGKRGSVSAYSGVGSPSQASQLSQASRSRVSHVTKVSAAHISAADSQPSVRKSVLGMGSSSGAGGGEGGDAGVKSSNNRVSVFGLQLPFTSSATPSASPAVSPLVSPAVSTSVSPSGIRNSKVAVDFGGDVATVVNGMAAATVINVRPSSSATATPNTSIGHSSSSSKSGEGGGSGSGSGGALAKSSGNLTTAAISAGGDNNMVAVAIADANHTSVVQVLHSDAV